MAFFTNFYNEYINSQWQDRIEKVLKEVVEKINEFSDEEKNRIKNINNFASILKTTFENSTKDVDENKIRYYVSSIVNIIKLENIDNVKLHIFLNYLKDFSILHLKTLEYFKNPGQFYKGQQTPLQTIVRTNLRFYTTDIERDCPEIIKDPSLLNLVMKDLKNKGMLTISSLNELSYTHGGEHYGCSYSVIKKETTELGDKFLEFINLEK